MKVNEPAVKFWSKAYQELELEYQEGNEEYDRIECIYQKVNVC